MITIPLGYDCPHEPKVPDEIVKGSTVYLLGQNPGREEEEEGRPYVGATGQVMVREFFPEANLVRGENVSIGNTICYRFLLDGKPTNKLPSGKVLQRAIELCSLHRSIPPSTRLIIASGAAACKASGNDVSVTDWRGFILPVPLQGRPVLATLHVADLFGGRNRKMLWPSHRDWRKVPLFLAGKWPAPLPEIVGVSHMEEWFDAVGNAPFIALDTEYNPESQELHTIGLGVPGSKVLQLNWPKTGERSKHRFGELLLAYPGRLVFQNAPADIEVLRKAGILQGDYREIFTRLKIEDTMLAHSVLWAEWPHTLEFLASIYGSHPKMKHLSKTNPALYNAGDVVDTLSVWEGEEEEFAKDPRSRVVYRTQPIRLLPIIMRSHERGIRVNKERVGPALVEYVEKMGQASQLARSYTGRDTFNVGSDDQLKAILYDSEGLPVQKQKSTKKPSIDTDSIASLRRLYDPIPDFEREEREGLEWVEVERRVQDGAHPLLEARVFYAAAQQSLTHYILPCYIDRKHPEKGMVERLYPEFHIHAQANARWSTLNPPMAQLPDDLRDIVMPDEGHMWFKYDHDQMELRINAVMCHDEPSIETFQRGWDIHTLNACDLFGLPYPPDKRDPHTGSANQGWRAGTGWKGKDDPRRVFAKRFIYRLDYGGDPARAGDIPGAKALGLTSTLLVQASNRYLAAHPAKARWRRETRLRISRPPGGGVPTAETFTGRKRRISEVGPSAWRIAFDYPMQAGVSDVENLTAVRIDEELPWLELMFQMHDGWYWQSPQEKADETRSILKGIVEAPHQMYGESVSFPASWKEIYP